MVWLRLSALVYAEDTAHHHLCLPDLAMLLPVPGVIDQLSQARALQHRQHISPEMR